MQATRTGRKRDRQIYSRRQAIRQEKTQEDIKLRGRKNYVDRTEAEITLTDKKASGRQQPDKKHATSRLKFDDCSKRQTGRQRKRNRQTYS
jgi:hypothetical protein